LGEVGNNILVERNEGKQMNLLNDKQYTLTLSEDSIMDLIYCLSQLKEACKQSNKWVSEGIADDLILELDKQIKFGVMDNLVSKVVNPSLKEQRNIFKEWVQNNTQFIPIN
jgi:hypothetical protein